MAPARTFLSFNERDPETISIGARIAGVVLILNALSAFYAAIVLQVPLTGPSRSTSAVVDLILGGLLVLGRRKVVPFCVVRIVLGAVLFLGLSLAPAASKYRKRHSKSMKLPAGFADPSTGRKTGVVRS